MYKGDAQVQAMITSTQIHSRKCFACILNVCLHEKKKKQNPTTKQKGLKTSLFLHPCTRDSGLCSELHTAQKRLKFGRAPHLPVWLTENNAGMLSLHNLQILEMNFTDAWGILSLVSFYQVKFMKSSEQ